MTAPAPQRPPARQRPGTRSPPAWLVYGAMVVVGVVIGAVAFAAVNAPGDIIRDEIAAAVRAETGRELTFSSAPSFSFFPSPGLVLRNATLSPPHGMKGAPTATIHEIAVEVRLWPLLRQRVEMQRIVLRKPVLDLRIDAQGRRSWDQASSISPARVRLAEAGTTRTDATPTRGRRIEKALDRVEVGEVAIEGATVRFADERRGTSGQLDAVDARVTFPPGEGPARLKGTLLAAGEPVRFEATLGSLDGLIRQQPETLDVVVSSAPLDVRFNGSVHVRPELALAGRIESKSPSARDLVRWLGTALPPSRGFGALAFSGDIGVDGPRSRLSNATVTMDGATANGDIATDVSGPRPRVKAVLSVSALDLDAYAALAPEAPAAGGGNAGGATKVKGYTRRAGWSEQPIDTTLMGLVDGEAHLTLGGLKLHEMKLGRTTAALTLADKRLTWRIEEAQVYSGKVRGTVVTDASSRPVKVAIDLAADDVSALPLLTDAAGFDWISGRGKVRVSLRGQGDSERAIVAGLAGTTDMSFADGAIVGFNAAKILRGLGRGQLSDFERVPTERTDFSEMAARFVIKDGVASNDDLRLVSPLVRVGGAGRILLESREIDYTMRPRLVASLTGQGAREKPADGTKGLEVPIRITGPWDAPSINADVGEILKDPDKAVEAVKEIGRALGGKKAGDFLDKLFGKN